MKHERTWYTCNYCNTEVDGATNMFDNDITPNFIVTDICDNLKCYKKHIETVRDKMIIDESLLFYPMDMSDIEYKAVSDKYMVKWFEGDKWHSYQRKSLVKRLIPIYEKLSILNNKYL